MAIARSRRAGRESGTLGRPIPRRLIVAEGAAAVDMYARAAMGTKAEDAVAWAERELRKVYEA